MDYKNSKEGLTVQRKYADILPLSPPEPSFRHPRMPVDSRAKIFSPFAALRGYEEEIAEEGRKRTLVPKRILSEEDIGTLSDLLMQVRKGMRVTIRYFRAEGMDTGASADAPMGTYEEVTGTVTRLEPDGRRLRMFDGEEEVEIGFDDLDMVTGDEIVGGGGVFGDWGVRRESLFFKRP